MEPTAITASTTGTASSSSSSAKKATESKESFATLFAAAEKKLHDGEKLAKVTGHQYAKINGGDRDGEYVNLSGNARSGQAFQVVERNGHTFHAYGTGKDRVVVDVTAKKTASAKTTGGTQAKS